MKKIILTLFMVCSLSLVFGCQPQQNGGNSETNTYKLSFYDKDEELIETVKLEEGAEIEFIEAPEVEGFEFVAWVDENGEEFEETEMPAEDVKLYASYKEEEHVHEFVEGVCSCGEKDPDYEEPVTLYTYKFVDWDGTVLYERKVKEGTRILVPASPTREKEGFTAYTFNGWVDENGEKAVFPLSIGTTDLVFTATYTSRDVVVVKYEINGGNWSYYGYSDVVKDLLKDYNKFAGTSYTVDTLPTGAWECTNFHSFYYSGSNKAKWSWLVDYLTAKSSAQNYKAMSKVNSCNSASELNALDSNYKYSVSYEFRAFIIGGIVDSNASYPSADYSTYEMQNNFWEYYHEFIKDTLVVEYEPNKIITLKNAYKADHEFVGWYDNPEFTGSPLKSVKLTADITLYAKFNIPNPVSEIKVNNAVSELSRYETLQLEWEVLPSDAGNKKLKFASSNPDVVSISQSGLITANECGKATITISSILTPSTKYEFEIEVYIPNRIEVEMTSSVVNVFEEIVLTPTFFGRNGSNEGLFEYSSNNTAVATVDASGVITGVSAGNAEIIIKELNTGTTLSVGITVLESELSEILNLIVNSHESNVFIRDNLPVGAGTPAYYKDIVGSVNKILFNNPLSIDTSKVAAGDATGNYYTLRDVEFITVHYTGNMSAGADALANANYFVTKDAGVSIHYTTGNDGVYQCLSLDKGAWHAGDSSSISQVGQFEWFPTGVAYDGTDLLEVEFSASDDFYFEINGKKTSVKLPTPYNYNSRNTDHIYNADGTISSQPDCSSRFTARTPESFFNEHGFAVKVVNGEYYMGKTWWCYSQVSEGRICSNGGNYNSIGIESCVNKGSDLWYTWQKTAQLVAYLMQEFNLSIERVKGHHFYTAKDCPQPMLENDLEIWYEFVELVQAEYELLTKFSGYNITVVSNNPEIVNNRGRVIKRPYITTSVSYTVTIEKDGNIQTITLYSMVEGEYNK